LLQKFFYFFYLSFLESTLDLSGSDVFPSKLNSLAQNSNHIIARFNASIQPSLSLSLSAWK